MNINTGLNILKQMLKSGEAVGAKVKIGQIAEGLSGNSKTISEQLGQMMGGKGQEILRGFEEAGGFEQITARINELAKMYPEAAVELGIKQSKRGFTVVKASVKNGKNEIMNQAVSVTKDGAIKSRAKIGKTSSRYYADSKGNFSSTAEKGTTRADVRGNSQGVTASLTDNGEQVLSTQVKFGTSSSGTQAGYEAVDGVSYFNFSKKGIGVNGIYSQAGMSRVMAQEAKESREELSKFIEIVSGKKGGGKPSELLLQILKPLRERFNIAVDLYKYNGKTFFERFLSKSELEGELAKVIKEEKSISSKIKEALKSHHTSTSVTTLNLNECPKEVQDMIAYQRQLDSDIEQARELIRITC